MTSLRDDEFDNESADRIRRALGETKADAPPGAFDQASANRIKMAMGAVDSGAAGRVPTTTGSGIDAAIKAVEEGSASLYDIMVNTGKELEVQFGKENVRPVLGAGGLTGYEIRNSEDLPWKPYEQATAGLKTLLSVRSKKALEGADLEKGAPFLERAKASFKFDPEAEINFWAERVGDENVRPILDDNGRVSQLLIRRSAKEKFHPVDPSGPDVGDIADMAGGATRVIPGAIGSIAGAAVAGLPGAVAGGAAGDFAADVAAQSIGAALPGSEEHVPVEQRLGSAAINVGAGMVGEGIGAVGGKMIRAVEPTNILSRSLRKEVIPRDVSDVVAKTGITGKQRAAEIMPVAEKYGIVLSPAMATGSRKALNLEDTVRSMAGTGDIFQVGDIERFVGLTKVVKDAMRQAAGDSPGAFQATQTVAKAFDGLKGGLVKGAEDKAQALFKAADMKGAAVGTDNIIKAIDTYIERLQKIRGPSAEKEIAALQAIRERTPPVMMLDEWHQTSRRYAMGQVDGSLGTSLNKQMGNHLFAAMNRDLDEADILVGEAGRDLRAAKKAWKGARLAEEYLDTQILNGASKLAGKESPEKFISGFWSDSVTPVGVKKSLQLLKRSDRAYREFRAAVLENFMRRAAPKSGEFAEMGTDIVGPAQFASMMTPENKAKLRAMMPKESFNQLLDAETIARAYLRVPSMGSRTAIRESNKDWFSALSSVAAHPKETLTKLALYQRGPMLARIFNSPDATNAFLHLVKPKRNITTREINRLMARIESEIFLPPESDESRILGISSQMYDERPIPAQGASAPPENWVPQLGGR